jgi:hypothetical protein
MVRTSQQLSGAAGKPPYVRQSHAAEYARGEVDEHRAECLFPLLKPYLRVFRGISTLHLPGYLGFFQCLRNIRLQNAVEQAERIVQAALDPIIASRARRGEFATCLDYCDLLQPVRN